jgi:hypothetical protein
LWDDAAVTDYSGMNRENWDERVAAHVGSPDYAVDRFRTDPHFVSGVVAFDRPTLGDVRGPRCVVAHDCGRMFPPLVVDALGRDDLDLDLDLVLVELPITPERVLRLFERTAAVDGTARAPAAARPPAPASADLARAMR